MRSLLFAVCLLGAVGGMRAAPTPGSPPPPVQVEVRDNVGRLIHRETVPPNGVFQTDKLDGGTYTVYFKASGRGLKGAQYALFLASGRNKVTEDALAGERLAAPGVAMNILVPRTAHIVGQVANGRTAGREARVYKVRIVNGRRYIWAPPSIGTNIAGRWVEEGSAEGYNILHAGPEWLQRIQDKGVGIR